MGAPIESGSPCLKHGCSLCCYKTSMPLTRLDINRIVKLGYKIRDFAEKVSGCWRLKNVNGKCFFLDGNLCQIYKYRPYGCRLYPLVFDLNKHRALLDDYCPYRWEFKVSGKDVRKLMFIINLLEGKRSNKFLRNRC